MEPKPGSEGHECTISILCQGRHAGGFIGRSGSSIEAIRKQSQATIKVSFFKDGPPAGNGRKLDRLVEVSGRPDTMIEAVKLISFRFAEISADNVQFSRKRDGGTGAGDEWKRFELTMLVPAACVGRIVGAKGKKIKEISQTHGCKINVSREVFPSQTELRRTELQHTDLEGIANSAMDIARIIQKNGNSVPAYPHHHHQQMYPHPQHAYYPPPPHHQARPQLGSGGYITTEHHPASQAPQVPPPPPPRNGHGHYFVPPAPPQNPHVGYHHASRLPPSTHPASGAYMPQQPHTYGASFNPYR